MSAPPTPAKPSPAPHRSPILTVGLVLAVLILLAGYLYWQRLQQPPAPLPPDNFGILDPESQAQANDNDPSLRLLNPQAPPPTPSDFLLRQPGDQVLLSEPAGLPAPPGGQRLAGVRQTLPQGVTEISFWNIPGQTPAEVLTFYTTAAQRMGFTPLPRTAPASQAARQPDTRLFMKSPPTNSGASSPETLTLTLFPDSATGVRVVIWWQARPPRKP